MKNMDASFFHASLINAYTLYPNKDLHPKVFTINGLSKIQKPINFYVERDQLFWKNHLNSSTHVRDAYWSIPNAEQNEFVKSNI